MADDDEVHESEDDALEDTRPDDIFDPDTDEEKLAEDNDPPFTPPSATGPNLPSDHPVTDDNLDEDEVYSEGMRSATGLDDAEEDSDNQPAEPLEPEDEE